MQWRLARNFAALESHRRNLHDLLIASKGLGSCRPAVSRRGEATLVHTLPPREAVVLSPGGEPAEALRATLAVFEDDIRAGRCLALCGIGDGHLLTHLAANPPQLQLGQQQCIHIIEPHPEVLLGAMMIHEWWEEGGPFADRRFQWWVGPEWAAEIHAALDRDPYLPYPERPARLSMVGEEIDANLRELLAALIEGEKRLAARVEKKYAGFTPRFAEPHRGRRPRVLLLTTRFSTVLQHSTRDLAAAFEELGWSVRMPIEPGNWQRNSRRNLLRHLADFQPDLVVQIDHLRHEHRGLFPPALPFVCWIQDDLPNLTSREAGANIGLRDFVLTSAPQVYVHDHGYPQRQCITFAKRTRPIGFEPSSGEAVLHDIAFVSNASEDPGSLAKQLAADFSRGGTALGELIAALCRQIIDAYEGGGCIEAVAEVEAMLHQESQRRGGAWNNPETPLNIARRLFSTLNNALYRQQALSWVMRLAEARGLNFGLYGRGWETHREFAGAARGVVEYGEALEDLTRRSRINLQIVPYSCLHQRLLDGVAAGGFFLIREHPIDRLTLEFKALMDLAAGRGPEPQTMSDLRRMLNADEQGRLDDWLRRRQRVVDHRGADPVARFLAARCEGRTCLYELIPGYDDVAFDTPARLALLVDRYLADEPRRRAVVSAQRNFIEKNYSYCAGVGQMIAVMIERLRGEPAQPTLAQGATG